MIGSAFGEKQFVGHGERYKRGSEEPDVGPMNYDKTGPRSGRRQFGW